jgi:hypothetical protein
MLPGNIMCGCGNNIEPERVSLSFINCSSCAHRGADTPRVKGRMVYGHKTAGEIEIMTAETFNSNKKYFTPNGARSAVKNFSRNICS